MNSLIKLFSDRYFLHKYQFCEWRIKLILLILMRNLIIFRIMEICGLAIFRKTLIILKILTSVSYKLYYRQDYVKG